MPRRQAATLVEVLVAIFVMAIGLMAILVLFPLGALRMAQAIQDQHASDSARNAIAIANFLDVRRDPLLFNPSDPFLNPPKPLLPLLAYPPVDPDGPSYPVFVDANGWRSAGGSLWLGDSTITNPLTPPPLGVLPRRTVTFVENNANPSTACIRWFSLLDDINFDIDGTPKIVAPSTFERNTLYSWAYLLQRPRARDNSVMDVSVVVYRQRPLSLAAGGLNLPEFIYKASYDTSRNVITLDYSATGIAPTLRSGDWVLDSTPVTVIAGNTYYPYDVMPATPPTYRTAHGNFYRVVSLTDDLPNQKIELEVQQPLRSFPGNSVTFGTAIYLEGVIEVFDKGTGWRTPSSLPGP